MKKILLGMLILSVVSLADGPYEVSEEILEKQFEGEHSVIGTKGKELKNIDYDVTIAENKAILELEIESSIGDGNWSKVDKVEFEKVVAKMVEDIKEEMKNPNLEVTVFLGLDKTVGSDEILFSKKY